MRILCFGDSNTYGFDPRSFFDDRYGSKDRWPDLLTGHEVINEGANGRQIPRNPYILRLLREHAPVDLVVVMLGTNDLLQGATAEDTAARMERFLTGLLPRCPRVLLLAPPPMKRGAWLPDEGFVNGSLRLADLYRALAAELGIPFADPRGWGLDLCFDGVHLTEEDHHRFAKNLQKILDSHPT